MGILNKHFKKCKSESLLTQQTRDKIIKANFLFDNQKYSDCAKVYSEILNELADLSFVLPETYEIIKRMINVSYELGAKDNAYMYIALLALTERSKANLCDYVFTVAKISYEANDIDFAKGFIQASYYSTDGAYFCSPESKELLHLVGINDNRTFDDYSQDY